LIIATVGFQTKDNTEARLQFMFAIILVIFDYFILKCVSCSANSLSQQNTNSTTV